MERESVCVRGESDEPRGFIVCVRTCVSVGVSIPTFPRGWASCTNLTSEVLLQTWERIAHTQ